MDKTETKRIDQWFVRGIAIIASGLVCTIFILTFSTLNQESFYPFENHPSIEGDHLIEQIGMLMGTSRVYDLLILLSILLIIIIGSYYLINFDAVENAQSKRRKHI